LSVVEGIERVRIKPSLEEPKQVCKCMGMFRTYQPRVGLVEVSKQSFVFSSRKRESLQAMIGN
jgi:hypothetical protein